MLGCRVQWGVAGVALGLHLLAGLVETLAFQVAAALLQEGEHLWLEGQQHWGTGGHVAAVVLGGLQRLLVLGCRVQWGVAGVALGLHLLAGMVGTLALQVAAALLQEEEHLWLEGQQRWGTGGHGAVVALVGWPSLR